MLDILKRFIVIAFMGLCIGLLFIGGRMTKAEGNGEKEKLYDWPVTGVISDYYGTRGGRHKGIDLAAPVGEKVHAVDDGTVKKSYYSSTYGNVIFIAHPDGYETVYAHLHKRNAVPGQLVKKGDIIGEVGNTGVSSGAHLHFEIHKGEWNIEKSNAFDPLVVMDKNVIAANAQADYSVQQKGTEAGESSENNEIRQVIASMNSRVSNSGDSTSSQTGTKSKVKESTKGNGLVKEVKVGDHDTLWSLSKKFGVSVEELKTFNGLKTDIIRPGQTLKFSNEGGLTYTVKQGDTLSKVAEMLGVTISELKQDNQLKSDKIYPKQILVVKGR